MKIASPLAAGLCLSLLAACSSTPAARAPKTTAPARPTPYVVAERYVSKPVADEELDSLATWYNKADKRTWLIASGKSTHRLSVFDAADGSLLRHVGGKGKRAGQFTRPNGLAVSGDLLFVVERDSPRVQVLRLPGFTPAGTFGSDQLRSPYGIWVNGGDAKTLHVYVTDSFMQGEKKDVVPPLAQLDQRVRRYLVTIDGKGRVQASYGGSFGDRSESRALRMVESLAGDPTRDRLLIADEATRDADGSPRESTFRSYSLAGQPSGRSLPAGSFDAEAEGIALWACSENSGYWIAADQLNPHTLFRVFHRDSLDLIGSFRGNTTAHTDGITLRRDASTAFPAGALYAVHDDKSVSAFDLRDVARTLGLPQACMQ